MQARVSVIMQQNSNSAYGATEPSVMTMRAILSSPLNAINGRNLTWNGRSPHHLVYKEHHHLFGYQPSVSSVLGSCKRKGKSLSDKGPRKWSRPLCMWKKEVACLRISDTM